MTTFGFRSRRGYLLCFTARTRTKTPQSLMPAQSPQGILKRSTAGHNHPTPPKTLLEWNYGWVDMIKKKLERKKCISKKKRNQICFVGNAAWSIHACMAWFWHFLTASLCVGGPRHALHARQLSRKPSSKRVSAPFLLLLGTGHCAAHCTPAAPAHLQ